MGNVIPLFRNDVEIYRTPEVLKPLARPLFMCAVPAGFPSPADDYIELELDLNELLIERPSATFYIKAIGDSLDKAGIRAGDVMIVDRSLEPKNGSIVIAIIDNELTVKLFYRKGEGIELRPDSTNPIHRIITIRPDQEFMVWGVVKGLARIFDRR